VPAIVQTSSSSRLAPFDDSPDTSAVGAVVVGFALQDTLGNLFAGLAIQVEKPFRVGHWVRVGEFEGRVQEVTWRATKLLTKQGQFVIVPNSVMSKDPIVNFSEPTIPTRIEVEVGATYDAPPNVVKRALHEALDNAPLVLREPPPDVIVLGFGSSSVDYRLRFWIDDFGRDNTARDQVRTNIWYTFKRHAIEIPYPIQVEYSREEKSPRSADRLRALADRLGAVDLFSGLDDIERARLAQACPEHLYGALERIVRQGDEGRSMFVVLDGRVRVTIEPSGQEVAVTTAGGFFGEMSMLTGDPRTATVTAVDDAVLLEIDADRFRELAVRRPGLVEHVSGIVSARRQGLADAKAAAEGARAAAPAPQSLLGIKHFRPMPGAAPAVVIPVVSRARTRRDTPAALVRSRAGSRVGAAVAAVPPGVVPVAVAAVVEPGGSRRRRSTRPGRTGVSPDTGRHRSGRAQPTTSREAGRVPAGRPRPPPPPL
jgi:CRP-like cAMP-binding protein